MTHTKLWKISLLIIYLLIRIVGCMVSSNFMVLELHTDRQKQCILKEAFSTTQESGREPTEYGTCRLPSLIKWRLWGDDSASEASERSAAAQSVCTQAVLPTRGTRTGGMFLLQALPFRWKWVGFLCDSLRARVAHSGQSRPGGYQIVRMWVVDDLLCVEGSIFHYCMAPYCIQAWRRPFKGGLKPKH